MQRKPDDQQTRNVSTPPPSVTPGGTVTPTAGSTHRARGSSQGGRGSTQSTQAKPPATPTQAGTAVGAEPGGGNDLLQHAKQTTNEVVDQVQQQAGSRVNRQKDEAATDLEKVASAVRQLGEGLGGEEQGPIAHYAAEYGKKAAEGIERLTNYLRENDAKKLFTEVENFGRRQPALLLGGAFLLGLAGARFLKSSMPTDEPNSRELPQPRKPVHVPTTSATL